MPITNIDQFLNFYDALSKAEMDAILNEYAPDESCENITYADEFLLSIEQQPYAPIKIEGEITTTSTTIEVNRINDGFANHDFYALAA